MRFHQNTLKKVLLIIALLGIYSLAAGYRIGICRYQLARQRSALFTGESALISHYGRLIAQGEKIPLRDRQAQFPEGLRVRSELSVGMELVMGWLYRFLYFFGFEFASFARIFTTVFFCTGIFAAYLIGRAVFADVTAGLGSAFFYAVSLPAVIRATGLDISREEFTLPLIFFHIYFFLVSWRDTACPGRKRENSTGSRPGGSPIPAIFSGLFLFAALSSWEGTQTYFYFLAVFAALKFLFGRADPRFFFTWVIALLFAILAGGLIPYLRAHYFLLSYAMLISYSLVAGLLISFWPAVKREGRVRAEQESGRTKKARIIFLLLAVVLVSAFAGYLPYTRTYSHFQTLLFYKLRFLNQKPFDPELLPYEARVLWTPALLRPSFYQTAIEFSTILVIGAVSLGILIFRLGKKTASGPEIFLHAAAGTFFLLYFLFSRTQVYLIFFLALLFGEVFTWLRKQGRRVYLVGSLCLGLFLVFEAVKTEAYGVRFGRPVDYRSLEELIAWLKGNTGEEAVVLSHFNHSPPILAYAGRAIVLQPKFETPAVREKVKRYAFSLFADGEDEFHAFSQRCGADYFVFPRGTFSDSSVLGWRYLTATAPDRKSSLAYRFEYHPEFLEKFLLVEENRKYRIFRIFSREETERAESYSELGREYLEAGDYRRAIEHFEKALEICPNWFSAHAGLGSAYYFAGDKEKAEQEWELIQRLRNPA